MGVASRDWPQQVSYVRQCLDVIHYFCLTINFSKYDFAKPEVKLVGYFLVPGTTFMSPTARK